MGHLPGHEQRGQEPAADVLLAEEQLPPGIRGRGVAGGGGPAHQRGDAADDGTDPGVDDGDALHGRVDAGVQEDVQAAEEGGRGVDAVVERPDAREPGEDAEERRAAHGDEAAHERPVARAAHHGVPFGLVKHVEGVGAPGAQGGAGGEEEEREGGEGRRVCHGWEEEVRDGVYGVGCCRGEDDEGGEAWFGEGEEDGEKSTQRVRWRRRGFVCEVRGGIWREDKICFCCFFPCLLTPSVREVFFRGRGGTSWCFVDLRGLCSLNSCHRTSSIACSCQVPPPRAGTSLLQYRVRREVPISNSCGPRYGRLNSRCAGDVSPGDSHGSLRARANARYAYRGRRIGSKSTD